MFYETAQTVGPGWHRSYKPNHYEDMTWSPPRHFRSPGSSPETYRRIIHHDDEFPRKTNDDDDFFSGRRSPTLPRRIFKEVWDDSPSSNHRFMERPRMFKKVFKPSRWDDEFDRDIPNVRRVEREFDKDFEGSRPTSRKFDDDFESRFGTRDLKRDIEEEFEKAAGRVHHIPIMVERRMEEMKSRFGRNSPPPASERADDDEESEEWVGPQVQRLRKTFEPERDGFSTLYNRHRNPRADVNCNSRNFNAPIPESWDPHVVHTLPTRKAHKASPNYDESRHTVSPKSVFRSYSETHEDVSRPQPQHSAAFRSHSDGHCPKQTYVTKIEVNLPSEKEREELRSRYSQRKCDENQDKEQGTTYPPKEQECHEPQPTPNQSSEEPKAEQSTKMKSKNCKHDSSSLQQIAAVLQNVEDLVHRVEAYNGVGRDKQYRFLDEMLTRCMLRLDDVDTEGKEDVRTARKAAVRQVQSCIDKLEAKANESESRLKSNEQKLENDVSKNDDNNASNQEDKTMDNTPEETKNEETPAENASETQEGDNEQTKL